MPYTRAELIAAATDRGYTFLTPDYFKKLVSRGVLPAASVPPSASGRGHAALWNDAALRHVLDACFFHEQNTRTDAIKLSLWLCGHHIDGAAPLLKEQLLRMRQALVDKIADGEAGRDEALKRLRHRLMDSGALSDIAYGSSYEITSELMADINSIQYCRQTPKALLSNFALPAHTGQMRDVTMTPFGEELTWTQNESTYPNPKIPSGRRTVLAVHLLMPRMAHMILDEQGFSLTSLAEALTDATKESLESARWLTLTSTVLLLRDYSSIQPHVRDRRLDLTKLLSAYHQEIGYFLASSPLFPYCSLLIAAEVYRSMHIETRISYTMGLQALAIDDLVKAVSNRRYLRKALFTLIGALEPITEQ